MTAIPAIKSALDLQSLVSEYVPLKRSGPHWLIICLWHKDSTPSCRIYEDHYYCFTCQAYGDVIDFIGKVEGLSKGAALRRLSERTGIPLDSKPMTRAERGYDREESEFAEWWWKRTRDGLARRLTAFVVMEPENADAAGDLWRNVAGLKPDGRRALALRCATAEERGEWQAGRGWDRWFAGVWMEMAKEDHEVLS